MSIADPVPREFPPEEPGVPREDGPSGPGAESHDEQLLNQFLQDQSEQAFTRLVNRHAGLVMGVCRRALGNREDAEDAFQATFLVLARKAATVRRGSSLSGWLYQTAYRLSLRARAGRARRREQSLEIEVMATPETFSDIASEHSQAVLDEELNRLPAKYRLPLFLCCVEGRSREEAARQLDLSAGAVKGRVERGRNLLRRRLMLRGVSFSVATWVLAGLQQSAEAAQIVSPSLIASTVQAGVQYAAGHAALGSASPYAVSLANRSVHMLSLSTVRVFACSVFAAGSLAVTASWLPAPAAAVAGDGSSPVTSLAPEEGTGAE
ncbi:MAG: sigma-70 family RNA polymerase sigma factor, partial [Planctomycetaceae bacterium]|nr:sigma-70 family RNA polymerase sigma factor [Planctomycetaceae bacterium]